MDATFVKELAEEEKIPCSIVNFDVASFVRKHRLSIQEGARRIRYQLLEELADRIKADRIALGHHADDQAETILLWILRGGGTEGLTGIPPVRNRYIRPLIETKRSELKEYCRRQGLKPRLDLSNLNMKYMRNRIRFELVPYLTSRYQKQLVEVLSRTAQIMSDENNVIADLTEEEFGKIAKVEGKEVRIYLPSFMKLSLAIKRRFLRRAIEVVKGNLKDVEFKHIESLVGYAGDNYKLILELPPKIRAFREYDYLILGTGREYAHSRLKTLQLSIPGCIGIEDSVLEMCATLMENKEDIDVEAKPDSAFLDYEKLSLPLKVRYRKKGDSFQPLGMVYSKKLQDFFVDEKVPWRERDSIPLVESENQIVWVAGYRIDERFKITPQTKQILKLELRRRP